MGEYWKPVNLTRGEFIHPHHVNEGLKLGEWNHPKSGVTKAMKAHDWKSTDDVRAVSDYGGQLQLSGRGDAPWPDFDTLEEDFVEVGWP